MVNVKCNSDDFTYEINIDESYKTAAHNVEAAKKRILEMIADDIDAAVNKKLDVKSSSLVDVEQMEKDHEKFLEMRRQLLHGC